MRWLFESIIFYWKSSMRIDHDKIRKCLKTLLAEQLLLTRIIVSSISLVVKFCREIFCRSCFSNTSRWLFLKLSRNNHSFLIQLNVSEHHHIWLYGFFSNFSYMLLLPSVLTFLVCFSPNFSGLKWKCFPISATRVMLILLGLFFQALGLEKKGYFC